MIEIIKELQIEVSKPNVFQAIVAKQYDMNTRFLKVTFVDNKEKISINHSETVSVIINALRPDGQSKGFDGEINNDGTVTVPLHSWMLELVGTVVCDISVIDTATKDNKKLTTTSFTLYVEQAAWGGEGITSDPQYDILIQLVNDCATARANADIALEKSAEADAKYDACVEATERANQIINSSGIFEKVKEQNTQGHIKFWVGTQEEYDNLEQMEGNCLHIITDDKTIEDLEDVKAKNLNTIDATNYFDLSSKYINHPVLIVLINYKETTTSTEGTANVVLTKTPLAYQGESVVLVNGTPKAIDYFLPIQDGFGDLIPTENKDGTITYANVSLYVV